MKVITLANVGWIISIILLTACTSNQQSTKAPIENQDTITKDIPFKIGKNYFVNNTYRTTQVLNKKIIHPDTFNQIFGMATVMGENGKPTSIDFSKEFVLAVIGEVSENDISYSPNSLRHEQDKLLFDYTVKTRKSSGATMQSSLILIIDKKFEKDSVVISVRTES